MRISTFELVCLILLSAILIFSILVLLAIDNGISTTLKEMKDLLISINDKLSSIGDALSNVNEKLHSVNSALGNINDTLIKAMEYFKDVNASVHRIELLLKGIRKILLDECVIPPQHAVLALKMDECNGSIVHDMSTHGNDGLIHNSSWTRGLIGCGLMFNGHSYVEVNHSESFNIPHNLTLELWARALPGTQGVLVLKGTRTTWPYMFKIVLNKSQLTWGICTASYEYEISTLAPEPEVWHQYALVVGKFRGKKELKVFIDGALIGKKEISTEELNTYPIASLKVGGLPGVEGFKGTVDQVYIYREVLGEKEIYRHYICGKLAHIFLTFLDNK